MARDGVDSDGCDDVQQCDVVLQWVPKIVYGGRSYTIGSKSFIEDVDDTMCWKIHPCSDSLLSLVLGQTTSVIQRVRKANGRMITMAHTDAWKHLVAVRNMAQATALLDAPQVDSDKLAALYGDDVTHNPRLGSRRKDKDDKAKNLMTIVIQGQNMRCVQPLDGRDGISVALDEQSLRTVLDFLSEGVQCAVNGDPDLCALFTRAYKRKADVDGDDDAHVDQRRIRTESHTAQLDRTVGNECDRDTVDAVAYDNTETLLAEFDAAGANRVTEPIVDS